MSESSSNKSPDDQCPRSEENSERTVLRVVIQHKGTFQFLRNDSDWTSDMSQANDFQRIQLAAAFCREHELRDVYIVRGQFNRSAKRFEAEHKTILDVKHLRAAPEQG